MECFAQESHAAHRTPKKGDYKKTYPWKAPPTPRSPERWRSPELLHWYRTYGKYPGVVFFRGNPPAHRQGERCYRPVNSVNA
ncbi:MAG: hypothetical protein F6J93_34815 [Oscillatoria sp. SIO1A7]|nr:hypothetical protein [Oscillatoria sp. SIO1A7]